MSFPRYTVDGDAAGGWMVEIHDGERCAVYSPAAATEAEALDMAKAAHAGVPYVKPEPPAPPAPPVEAAPAAPPPITPAGA